MSEMFRKKKLRQVSLKDRLIQRKDLSLVYLNSFIKIISSLLKLFLNTSFTTDFIATIWGKQHQNQAIAYENQERTGRFKASSMLIPQFHILILTYSVFMNNFFFKFNQDSYSVGNWSLNASSIFKERARDKPAASRSV